jgi:hypothetical protein
MHFLARAGVVVLTPGVAFEVFNTPKVSQNHLSCFCDISHFIGKNYVFNFLLVGFLKIRGIRSHSGKGHKPKNQVICPPVGDMA